MYGYRTTDPFGFDGLFRGFLAPDFDRKAAAPRQSRTRVTEEADRFVVRVELPGFTEEDVQVDLDKAVLTISAREKAPGPEAAAGPREEPPTLKFAVPTSIDPDQVSASMRAGVLTVSLPKRSTSQPRQIAIRAA